MQKNLDHEKLLFMGHARPPFRWLAQRRKAKFVKYYNYVTNFIITIRCFRSVLVLE
jgi:hypothetical protein